MTIADDVAQLRADVNLLLALLPGNASVEAIGRLTDQYNQAYSIDIAAIQQNILELQQRLAALLGIGEGDYGNYVTSGQIANILRDFDTNRQSVAAQIALIQQAILELQERLAQLLAERIGPAGPPGPVGAQGPSHFQFNLMVNGRLSVGNDKTLLLVSGAPCTVQEAYAVVKTAPTGSYIALEIERYRGGWETVVSSSNLRIQAGINAGSTTIIASPSLAKNDYLRLNIDHIGSTVPGYFLTVALRVVTPT